MTTDLLLSRTTEASFVPTDLNTVLWLDPIDAATVTTTTSGSDELIDQVNDKSGLSNHAIGTGTGRPKYVSGEIDFTGGATGFALTNNIQESVLNLFYLIRTTDTRWLFFSIGGSNHGLVANSGNTSTFLTSNFGSPTFYKDGNLQSYANRGAAYTALSTGNLVMAETIAADSTSWTIPFNIGNHPFGFDIEGECVEIVLVAGSITTLERQKMEGYLAHKHGLTGSLDVTHPYKTTAP